MDLEKLVSNIATGEQVEYSAEEIEGFANELKALRESSGSKDEIDSLKQELDETKKAHEELKNRIVDKLFSNPTGKPDEMKPTPKDDKDKEPKSFKDIIKPDYQIRN